MPDTSTLLAFAATAIAIELTPGPNMAYLAIVSAARGPRPGLAAVAGVALGLTLLAAIVGLGLGPLIMENRLLYQGLRWGGVAYLFWLAWEAWRDARRPLDEDAGGSLMRFFRRGLISNLLNPKAALFYLTVLPGFTDPTRAIRSETAVLSLIFVAVATAIHAGVVLGAGSLQPLLTQAGPRRRMGLIFAGLLVVVAGWLAWSTRG
ncbi:Threonine/homoserine/homoserine lactone efflux protein [Devosia enhydra]|uniref:Threonine/homoserine/homoserine lactone efflux protein n=1 Tax=Devosia enhydra TaxID=665118 RepID=A0A1K2HX06_9HYPH|nr:LysE family translocator [Devosia enhydra]SFZ83662.1 Threonine/homoserine/homoserine lactone efflux protein [Devosia enhydra]